ncbi:MAG: BREX-1 system adenine-specific DNA-methyltransferase PglX [Thermoanaerobaculia bacterium]
MDTKQLKDYGPKARRDFIAAVTDRAAHFGLTQKEIAPLREQGDVAILAGQAFPRELVAKRDRLIERIQRDGFDRVMEAIAYTWFNRLVAIRYMELHGYLEQGYRVLSHPAGKSTPEILDHAAEMDLPGLDREKVLELKLDGTRDEELYRLLLLAQCNALHQAMPFLFEKIGDETELLLPANLLHTDSLIRQLVEQIDEELWQEIEIIGWLYQFYISEKKDQVLGKVVKSEDIPAATQLFTPSWMVKYMVQNSIGAQWLATYPQSPLKGQMEYYIEPAEQTSGALAQLAATTPSHLNIEELTLIDPACGSGHILVEAYELFKSIYLERGYRKGDLPKLILEGNLYGLDIDERAAQLTGFALMMKGRADDRRLFEREVKLNVMAMVNSADFDAEALAKRVAIVDYGLQPEDLSELSRLFEHATTFGSLIQVPESLATKLPALKQLSEATSQDLFVSLALKRLQPLVQQAQMLAAQYAAVVANPPYLANKHLNSKLKQFLTSHFRDFSMNIFAAFMFRNLSSSKANAINAYVTPFAWMFLGFYQRLRSYIFDNYSVGSLVKPSYTSFFDSAVMQLVTFVVDKRSDALVGTFFDLGYLGSAAAQPIKLRTGIADQACDYRYLASSADFKKLPGSPMAYSASEQVLELFVTHSSLATKAVHVHGLSTGDNDRFVRRWAEVDIQRWSLDCDGSEEMATTGLKWFPFSKGGPSRRWFGNCDLVVNYANQGSEMRQSFRDGETPGFRSAGSGSFFQPAITWSSIDSATASFRFLTKGFVIGDKGPILYPKSDHQRETLLGLLNSCVVGHLLKLLSPTSGYDLGYVKRVPVVELERMPKAHVELLVERTKVDWDSYERSWDFQSHPILAAAPKPTSALESSYTDWVRKNRETIAEMKRLEEENNHLFIDAYGLGQELTPEVSVEQITLTVNPAYRYGGKLTEEALWTRFRQDTMEELVSYAIGCLMGRYSLDAPGLIYANSGNEGFEPSRYPTFPADADGILPLTDTRWFADDAADRVVEFLSVTWDAARLEENLTFLADNLSPRKDESSRETIRRYLCDKFFKDHLQTYKNRPIYWLFSSGKQKAFQCLIYLHRYNEGTLPRMRSEYVIPLEGKMAARLEKLQGDIQAASSTAHRKRLEGERAKLVKQQAELLAFDEKLRHYADMRIQLDLDDGVKVNYGKFGDLLAEVKTVTRETAD